MSIYFTGNQGGNEEEKDLTNKECIYKECYVKRETRTIKNCGTEDNKTLDEKKSCMFISFSVYHYH